MLFGNNFPNPGENFFHGGFFNHDPTITEADCFCSNLPNGYLQEMETVLP